MCYEEAKNKCLTFQVNLKIRTKLSIQRINLDFRLFFK
ncbi:hypothetical protein V6Z11_D04G102100 [Gossypium hirsutum]